MPIVKNEQVLERWGVLITKGKGKAEEVLGNTEKFLGQTNVPNIKVKKKNIAPGLIRRLVGTKRHFLVVTETKNIRLRPYQMYINVRDYGTNLDVSWYLVYRASFLTKMMFILMLIPVINLFVLPFFLIGRVTRGKTFGTDLDFFDEQDLRSYVTNAHHCLLAAVIRLKSRLKQDTAKIDRKSQGFLGIS